MHGHSSLQIVCRVYTCFKADCAEKKCPTDSAPYTPTITVIRPPGPLTVIEGQEGVMVQIEVSLPPRFLCAASEEANTTNKDCMVQVLSSVTTDGDLTCAATGAFIPQAVIGIPAMFSPDVTLPCGFIVTESNWFFRLQMIVKAMIDGVVDGDMQRQITMTSSYVVDETVLHGGDMIGTAIDVGCPTFKTHYISNKDDYYVLCNNALSHLILIR